MIYTQKFNRGVLLIFLSTLMFGSYGVWSRLIGSSMDVFYQGWTRGLVISIILLPILFFRKEIIPIEKRDWKWLLVFLTFTSATQAPIFYAYNHMDIGSASLLYFTTMLLTMYMVGLLFLKERLSESKLISFILALIGLYTIFSFSLEKFTLIAALMAILNGIASGGELAFSKKLSGNYSPLYLSALSWLIIFPTNGILSFVAGETQVLPSFNIVWLWQLSYIIVSLFGFWFVMIGLKYVEASIGGLLGMLEIIFSIAFGILLFGESLTVKVIVGTFLILSSASLPHINTLLKKYT